MSLSIAASPSTPNDDGGPASRADMKRGAAALLTHEAPVPAKVAAQAAGLSIPGFWKAVAEGRLPAPVYPLPRAPRWYVSEFRTALAATRALPAEAKAERRAAKLAAAE